MKKINIDIPDGYEIDVEASDFTKGKIIFKPVQKKWEDFGDAEYWYMTPDGPAYDYGDVNDMNYKVCDAYPTEELLLAAEAQRQLLFFRNRVWKEDNNWQPDWSNDVFNKIVISPSLKGMITRCEATISRPLAFRTYRIADQFLKDHKELIEQAKILL